MQSVYPIPPESFKVEVEEGNATEVTDGGLPDGIKQTGLVRLDNSTVSYEKGTACLHRANRTQMANNNMTCDSIAL